jgi:hypothetical protein
MVERQSWRDLIDAMLHEVEALGGYGEVTVDVVFHAGEPRSLKVRDRVVHYRLGKGDPPLPSRQGSDTITDK